MASGSPGRTRMLPFAGKFSRIYASSGLVLPVEHALDAVPNGRSGSEVQHFETRHIWRVRRICLSRWQPELDAIIGEHRMDFVGNGFDQGDQEGPDAVTRLAFSASWTKANFEVLSIATKR